MNAITMTGIALLALLGSLAAHAQETSHATDVTLYETQLEAKDMAQKKVARLTALLKTQDDPQLRASLAQWQIEVVEADKELIKIKQRCPTCDQEAAANSPLQSAKTLNDSGSGGTDAQSSSQSNGTN